MNILKFIFTITLISFLIFPLTFADSQSDYYFDTNTDSEGNGTFKNPYHEFSNDKITDNATVHFMKGNYSFTASSEYSNITFQGRCASETVLNGNGYTLKNLNYTNFKNITLTNFQIINEGNLTGLNAIFTNLIPTTISYNNSYGGAIYSDSNTMIYLENCSFLNNTAKYAGAISIKSGNLTIKNSLFMDNIASSFGGAIVSESSTINITNTRFYNNTAKNNAGGSLYLISSTLLANDLTIINSSARFGGAITSLNSKLNIYTSDFSYNVAEYDGGAVYQIYGTAYINSSKFINNSALNGGSLYVNNVNPLNITSSLFLNNSAYNKGNSIYMLLVNETFFDVNIKENDISNNTNVNLVFGSGNYTSYVLNQTSIDEIPSYYDLRDYGYVTPVKNQEDGGNCWAFAALAALESCILKASGDILDLSEENMKNIMALFSDYGFNYRWPNDGGHNEMAIGYLVSWIGPIFEIENSYDSKSAISPILNSSVHVQNVVLLNRNNYTDNDEIKKAILEYGAVATTMYYDILRYNDENKIYHYCAEPHPTNHAVTIVGWDDSFKIANAEGNGAWIVKNSWGSNWMHEGYFYVSYYDKCFAMPGSYNSFTFILNDTQKFDKNYQYDISGYTDFFYITNNTIWYKNQFIAGGDEFLAGVSTYFDKNTTWQLSIKVNDKIQLTQNSTSKKGYYTINLNYPIPLSKGDIFEVIFKLTTDGDVSFPISEAMSLTKTQYLPNVSFISYDGENWSDLYNFTAKYYDSHWYESQVASIKAFTQIKTLNSKIKSINITYDSLNLFNITAYIQDNDNNFAGNGKVDFNINGINYACDVYLGIASLQTKFSIGENNISLTYTSPNYRTSSGNTTFNLTPINLNLTINVNRLFNNAYIDFILSQNVNETLIINDEISVQTIDGVGHLNLENLDYGNYTINASIVSDFYTAFNNTEFFCNVKKTYIEVNNLTTIYNSGEELIIKLKDEFGQSISNHEIKTSLDNKSYFTNDEGIVLIPIRLNLSKEVMVYFEGSEEYHKSQNTSMITILSSIKLPNITIYALNSHYIVYLQDKQSRLLKNTLITFIINNVKYYCVSDSEGMCSFNIPLKNANVNIKVLNPSTGEVLSQNITILKRITENKDISIFYGGNYNYKVRVINDNGEYVKGINVTFIINGVKYFKTTDNKGYAYIKIKNLKIGKYKITTESRGFKVVNNVVIKSTLIAKNIKIKRAKTIKFQAKILNSNGKILKGKKITFKFKGKTYKSKTNKKGIATIKIKNKYSIGKYKIYTSYYKLKVTNIITIKK